MTPDLVRDWFIILPVVAASVLAFVTSVLKIMTKIDEYRNKRHSRQTIDM